jgi:hypothetical protein
VAHFVIAQDVRVGSIRRLRALCGAGEGEQRRAAEEVKAFVLVDLPRDDERRKQIRPVKPTHPTIRPARAVRLFAGDAAKALVHLRVGLHRVLFQWSQVPHGVGAPVFRRPVPVHAGLPVEERIADRLAEAVRPATDVVRVTHEALFPELGLPAQRADADDLRTEEREIELAGAQHANELAAGVAAVKLDRDLLEVAPVFVCDRGLAALLAR